MVCPHCHTTIEEQDEYLMSARIPKDDPALVRRQRLVLLYIVVFIAALAVFTELVKIH